MRRFVLALAVVAASPTLALAHTGADHAVGLVHGLQHPVGGLDHVLTMVVVGVFAFVLGGRALWLVPAAFVGMMVVGFGLGVAQFGVPFVELGIALSSIAIGIAALPNKPMPVTGAMALVGGFALFHGYAHGAEIPAAAIALDYATGFVVATAGLHAAGIAGSAAMAFFLGRHGRMAARVTSGLVALGGVGTLTGWI